MSGIEVAGLVLGAIPLILASMEFYAKGIAVSKRCLKYREQFESLLVELGTEKAICTNTIHLLLAGIVRQKDMSSFLADPGGSRWKEAHLSDSLRKRLGSSYESYTETIGQIRKTLDRFKQRLKLDASGKPQFEDVQSFRKYYKRLNFSLKRADYDDLMTSFRNSNSSLRYLTAQTLSLNDLQAAQISERRLMPRYHVIKESAQGCHSAIRDGWQCACHAHHGVHLRLEHRMDNDQKEDSEDEESMIEPFHVLFRYNHEDATTDMASVSVKTPWDWEEADIQITIEEQPSAILGTNATSGTKGVRFAKQAQKAVQAALGPTRNMEPIQSLCAAISTLQHPQRDMCLSLLANEYTKRRYGVLIHPTKSPSHEITSWSTRDLSSVLSDVRFSRRHRIQLAVTLASSVLQLHETPWLEDAWSHSDILFLHKSGKTSYTEPFVLQKHDTGSHSSVDSLPPIMRHVIRNRTLYTLGISLIELWFKKPLSDMHESQDGPLGTGDAQTELMTELSTATRLVESDLRDDAGGNYADAVRRCISCDFDCRSKKLDDAAFQKAVFNGVVAPVKETFDHMFRTT